MPALAYATQTETNVTSDVVPESCDPHVNDLLRSRAWMEAQREVEVSQTIITHEKRVFPPICRNALFDGAKGFTEFSFPPSPENLFILEATAYDAELCNQMQDIAKQARCNDIDEDKLFPSLSMMAAGGFRPFCKSPWSRKVWKAASELSFPLENAKTRPVKYAGVDPVKTWEEETSGESCDKSPLVISGVSFREVRGVAGSQTITEKTEGTCLAAGCYYDSKQSKCVAY